MWHKKRRSVPLSLFVVFVLTYSLIWVGAWNMERRDTARQETLCSKAEIIDYLAGTIRSPGFAPEIAPPNSKPLTLKDLSND